MRIRHSSARMVLVAAIAVVAFAAVASSAMAVSVEPLNTKFSGTSANFYFAENSGSGLLTECKKASFGGTSQTTKVNFVTMTPEFTECHASAKVGGWAVSFSKCTNQLKVIYNAGEKAELELTCGLDIIVESQVNRSEDCKIDVNAGAKGGEEQFAWRNVPTKSLETTVAGVFPVSFVEHRVLCGLDGFGAAEHLLIDGSVVLKGIEAH